MWAKPLPENAKIPLPVNVRRLKRVCFRFLPFSSSLWMSAPQASPPPPPPPKKKWLKIRWYRRRKGFQKHLEEIGFWDRHLCFFYIVLVYYYSLFWYTICHPFTDHLTVFGLFSREHFSNQYFLLLQTTTLTAAFVEWVDFLYIQLGKSISLAKWFCGVFNRSYSSFAIPREAVHTIMHNTVVVVRHVEGVYPASVVFVEVVWLAWSTEMLWRQIFHFYLNVVGKPTRRECMCSNMWVI